ncbi:MAG: hypothetical protein L0H83_01615, partial [Salinisphaera sp.]|nr:hypothetical protein [Salinisphaera sp.]
MMKRIVTTLCLVGWSASAPALSTQPARDLFQRLAEVAGSGGLATHQVALARLEDYPLYPYLLAADLRWRLGQGEALVGNLDAEIAAFLQAWPHLPPARGLRSAWIEDLSDRGRWQAVIAQVNEGDPTSLQCLATTARIRTQAAPAPALREQGLEYWLRGWSQPESCNPVFAWLETVGALGREPIVARARLAILDGNAGLARYLARKLPEDQRQPVKRWIRLVENPGDLHVVKKLAPDIAVYAYKRLALRDLAGAAALLPELSDRLRLSTAQQYEARRWVALLFAQNHD